MMPTVACREADSISACGHSEISIQKSAPLLKQKEQRNLTSKLGRNVHSCPPLVSSMFEELGNVAATMISSQENGTFGETVRPERRRIRQQTQTCSPPCESQAQLSIGNSQLKQYPRDSTDILLRKNSLITVAVVESGEIARAPASSSILRQQATSAFALGPPMHRTRLFSPACSAFPALDHRSPFSPHFILSPPRTKHHQHPAVLVPLVLATILCLAHCALSSPVAVNTPKLPTSSNEYHSAGSTPFTTAHISSNLHSQPSHLSHQPHHHLLQQNLIQKEQLNPIELKVLDHLINQKQLHHREFHHKPSRNSYGEHIFDPSSEEITMKLESSARTISTSQKRDIHESIEGMFISPHHQPPPPQAVNGRSPNGHHRSHHHSSHPSLAAYERTMFSGEQQVLSQPVATPPLRMENDADLSKEIPKWFFWLHPARTHLTLGEAHALVKSVINNGLVEKLDFKTLEHLTRKYAPGTDIDKDEDFIELHSETSNDSSDVDGFAKHGKIDKMSASKSFDNEEPLNPEEELLTINRNKEADDAEATDKPVDQKENQLNEKESGSSKSKSGPFASAIINEDLFKNYQNLEQVMQILMHSENTLKKRGEGPQLSIDSALTVLRERLLLELARRKAKATQNQIAINSEILKKLGRRRRSVDQADQVAVKPATTAAGEKRSRMVVNCDEANCNLHDLNSMWSNVHQSLVNNLANYNMPIADKAGQLQPPQEAAATWSIKPYYMPMLKVNQPQRFRNNDKYIAFNDDENDDRVKQHGNNLEVESPPEEVDDFIDHIKGIYRNQLTYSSLQSGPLGRTRINSRKPNFGSSDPRPSMSVRGYASPSSTYRRHSKMVQQKFSDKDRRQIAMSGKGTPNEAISDDTNGSEVQENNKLAVGKLDIVQQMM